MFPEAWARIFNSMVDVASNMFSMDFSGLVDSADVSEVRRMESELVRQGQELEFHRLVQSRLRGPVPRFCKAVCAWVDGKAKQKRTVTFRLARQVRYTISAVGSLSHNYQLNQRGCNVV